MGYQFFPNLSRIIHTIGNFHNVVKVRALHLATGLRIFRAADDSPDLFISDYLKQLYKSYGRGLVNLKELFAGVRTVDDAIEKIYSLAVKIKALVIEAAGKDYRERELLQSEINEYVRNIKQIISQTEYDGYKILNGDAVTVYYGGKEYLIINGDKDFKNRLKFLAQPGSGNQKAVLGFETIDKTTGVGVAGAGTKDNPFIFTYQYQPDTGSGVYSKIWKNESGSGVCVETTINSSFHILQCFGGSVTLAINQYYIHYEYNPTADTLTAYAEEPGATPKTEVFCFSGNCGSTGGGTSGGSTTSSEAATLKAYDSASGEYSVDLKLGSIEIQVASALSTLEKSLENVEEYLVDLDRIRGYYAALENKLLNIAETNAILVNNWREAESVVRQLDYASAYTELVRNNILKNVAETVFAVQFQIPQLIIRILNAPVWT